MADSIRQLIVDAVQAQFQEITTANGYETNLGNNIFLWRDLESSPATEAELPLCNLADWKEITSPQTSSRNDHHHTLFFHIECLCAKSTTASADKVGRKVLADVIRAVGAAYDVNAGQFKWWDGKGFLTLPVEANEGTNIFDFEQKDKSIFSVKYQFKIEYRTARWDAYTQ